jgi:hypothetical protein
MSGRRPIPVLLGVALLVCVEAGHGADPTQIAAPAAQPALPRFQPGLWEYRRTQLTSSGSKPKTETIRRCTDPNAEFARKLAQLQQRGCRFAPLKQHGRSYEISWRCSGPDGAILAIRDIITVNSDTSYLDESEAVVSHEATHSSTAAIRQGDCPNAGRAPAAAHP